MNRLYKMQTTGRFSFSVGVITLSMIIASLAIIYYACNALTVDSVTSQENASQSEVVASPRLPESNAKLDEPVDQPIEEPAQPPVAPAAPEPPVTTIRLNGETIVTNEETVHRQVTSDDGSSVDVTVSSRSSGGSNDQSSSVDIRLYSSSTTTTGGSQ